MFLMHTEAAVFRVCVQNVLHLSKEPSIQIQGLGVLPEKWATFMKMQNGLYQIMERCKNIIIILTSSSLLLFIFLQ